MRGLARTIKNYRQGYRWGAERLYEVIFFNEEGAEVTWPVAAPTKRIARKVFGIFSLGAKIKSVNHVSSLIVSPETVSLLQKQVSQI